MSHEKEIDKLGVEYSAGIEDFKEYVTRLINMEPEEIAYIFYNDTARVVDEDDPELYWKVLTEFSARGIVDTLDSYDMKKEQKVIAITKLLKPGTIVYLNHVNYKNFTCKTPVLILGWRDYYDSVDESYYNRLDESEVIITFYDLVSQMIIDDEVVRISDITEVDFAYDDIDDLVIKFMEALKAQSNNYFEWEDRKERIKHDGEAPAKRCGRFKWEDNSRLYKAAEEALNKEREEREKAVIRNRIDELSYSGRSLRERFPNLYSEEDND